MNKLKFRTRVCLLIVLTLLLFSVVGFAVGKYMTTIEKTGQFTVAARLADSLEVQEHKAVRQNDGTYVLNNDEIVSSNTYVLMPGVDIPKDPHVVITGKTEIPAYLYLTVTDSTNAAITYTLENHWKDPENDGTYIYSTSGTTGTPITTDMTIDILKDDLIYVSHTLLGQKPDEGTIEFSATLTEVVETQNSN